MVGTVDANVIASDWCHVLKEIDKHMKITVYGNRECVSRRELGPPGTNKLICIKLSPLRLFFDTLYNILHNIDSYYSQHLGDKKTLRYSGSLLNLEYVVPFL